MAKEKKITFKYYLNKRLKSLEKDERILYPVYVRVTFNRKSAEIVCYTTEDHYLYWDEKDLESFLRRKELGKVSGGIEKVIMNHEMILNKIVRERYRTQKDEFNLRGIINDLKFHTTKVVSILEESSRVLLKNELKILLSPNEFDIVKRGSAVDMFHSAIGLKPQLESELSYLVRQSLFAFISYTLLLSPYPYSNKSKASLLQSKDNVYSWVFEGVNMEYSQFVSNVLKDDILFNKIMEKAPYDKVVRLFSVLYSDSHETSKLVNLIENQLLTFKS